MKSSIWKDKILRNKKESCEIKPKWSFIDGPITANNAMGIHHAWGRTS